MVPMRYYIEKKVHKSGSFTVETLQTHHLM